MYIACNRTQQNIEISCYILIGAPEGVGLGGLPGGVGGVSLETDVDTVVVDDLVTRRVSAYSIPVAMTMAVATAVLLMVRSVSRRSGMDRLLLRLGALIGCPLLLKQPLLVREPLALSLCGLLGLAAGLLFLLLVSDHLVGQKSGTHSQETAQGCNTNIGGALLVLHRLDALLVGFRDMGLAASKACGGGALARNAGCGQGQGDLALLLASRGVDGEGSVQDTTGSVDDLAQVDGGKTDHGIGSSLLVHDLEEEFGLTIQGNSEGLVPDRVLAGILVDKSLLERLGVGDVERELKVGVLLADSLRLRRFRCG